MSDTDFFLNQTGGSVSTQLGTRLSNIKNQVLSTQSVIGIQPDNSTDAIPYTAFGKSLLNVSTLNGLVGLLNSADSKVEVIDSGTGSIDFTLDNALKLSVKNAYTEVLNELRTLNVKPATDLGADLGDANKRYNTGFIRKITTNSVGQVSIGDNANTLGTSSVNIGNGAGGTGTPDYSVCIGRGANSEQSHSSSICLGYASGQKGTTQRSGIIAIGHSAGTGITGVQGMLNNAIAIGASASLNGGGVDSVAIGAGANGNSVANSYSVAIGSGAGSAGQGSNCIAIGQLAGQTNQNNNTIILNATGVAVNSSGTDRCHIAPIRSGGTGNVLNYDTGSKEVLSGGNVSMQTLTSQGLNPDILNSRDIGTTSLPWNGVYCNGLIQPSATNAMTFNTNSAERMRISSSGNVGIGTANPQNQLNIEKQYGGALNEAGSMTLSTISGGVPWGCGAISGYINAGLNNDNSSFPGGLLFKTKSAGGAAFNLTTRMVLDALGNLGLNNTAPQERLDVGGNLKVNGNIIPDSTANVREIGASGNKFNNVFSTTFTGALSGNASSATFASIPDTRFVSPFTPKRPTASVAEFRARQQQEINELCEAGAANSNLGVGNFWGISKTIVPWSDPSGGRMYQYYYSSNGIVYFRKSDQASPYNTEAWTAWRDASPDKCILTDSTDTISGTKTFSSNILFDADNQRNVGSSGQALNSVFAHNGVFKAITVHSATAGNIGTLTNPFNTAYLLNADIGNLVSNIKSMNITPTTNNQYTIGSSSSTQYNAIYGNSIYANGTILTSDINKKKDIQPIEDALSVIMRFESKSFKFKDGTSGRTHTGFIAQQIKEVVPDDWALYCDNKLGDIGLKYTEIIPLNTRAIQQLNERLSKVESRKLVGGAVIDTSGLTEDFVSIYQRLEALESEVNKPVKPQLHRCVEVSRINEMMDRISNLECNESKSNSSEDFELMHSLMEKNHQQELRINELENKLNQIQSQPKVESKSVDFLAESDGGGLSMIESLQDRLYKSEQLISKQQKMITKLTTAVNKILKEA